MSKLDLLEQKAKAAAADPKWTARAGHIEGGGQAAFAREHRLTEDDTDEEPSDVEERCAEMDAAFIAAANPQTVLAMIEAIRAAVPLRADAGSAKPYSQIMHHLAAFDAALAKLEGGKP